MIFSLYSCSVNVLISNMVNIDFGFLKSSIGKILLFQAKYYSPDGVVFNDVFYATLLEVHEDYIIVAQFHVISDEKFENEKYVQHKRKLNKGRFSISKSTPLSR